MSAGIGIGGFPDNPNLTNYDIFNNIAVDIAHTPYKTRIENLAGRDIVFTHNLAWPGDNRLPRFYRERQPDLIWDLPEMDVYIVADPLLVDPQNGDFRLRSDSPARGAGVDGQDLGALPYGAPWIPGLDFAMNATPLYRGAIHWQPVEIPSSKFNTFRNNLMRPRFFQESRYGEDLQIMPSGTQAFAGVIYEIEPDHGTIHPNVITLAGRQSEVEDEHVTGIPIGRKADFLAFLHTAFIRGEQRKEALDIAEYIVNYADGSSVRIPLTTSRNIEYWSRPVPEDLPEAEVAYALPTRLRRDHIAWSQLYSFEWENPHPDRLIETVDVRRVGDPAVGTIGLFAISAGDRQAP